MIKVEGFYCDTITELSLIIENFIVRHKINRAQIISINLSSNEHKHYALITYEV